MYLFPKRDFIHSFVHFIFYAAKENEIFVNLTKAAKENGHFNIYNHENLPERWNANNARRLGPILAVADIKYAFQDMFESAEYYKKAFNVPSK